MVSEINARKVLFGLEPAQVDACAGELRAQGAILKVVVPGACCLVEGGRAHEIAEAFEAVELNVVKRWPKHSPRLVTFDMDSTLIQQEVIDELAREAGCYAAVSEITDRAMRGELDFSQSLALRVSCLEGLQQERAEAVLARIRLSPGAKELVRALHKSGVQTAILSGGFSLFAEPLAERLGIHAVRCNRLVVRNGYLTGEVESPVVDSAAKADALLELCRIWRIDPEETMAIGDGANDLQVLAASGMGIAWHAKAAVRDKADLAIKRLPLSAVACLFHPWKKALERV